MRDRRFGDETNEIEGRKREKNRLSDINANAEIKIKLVKVG